MTARQASNRALPATKAGDHDLVGLGTANRPTEVPGLRLDDRSEALHEYADGSTAYGEPVEDDGPDEHGGTASLALPWASMRSDGGSTATAAGGAAAAAAMTGSVKKKSPSEPSSHCGTSAGTVSPPPQPGTASSAAASRQRPARRPGARVAYLAWLARAQRSAAVYLLRLPSTPSPSQAARVPCAGRNSSCSLFPWALNLLRRAPARPSFDS